MNEKGPDARGIMAGIEQGVGVGGAPLIASVQGSALAPAAATDDGVVVEHHEIRAIGDQLPVDCEHTAERPFDLRGRVIRGLQQPRRQRDKRFKCGHIAH